MSLVETTLSPARRGLARSRLYALLARLFREGLAAELLPLLAELPGLAEHLPAAFNGDEAAAEHYRLLGREILPCASLFLDPVGMLGGARAEAVQASYQRLGFAPHPAAVSPDAISEELGLLAFLAGAEAEAWEDDRPGVAHPLAVAQQEFLTEHLLPWLFPFALALKAEGSPFYTALADLAVALVAEQTESAAFPQERRFTFALPAPPPLLEEPQSGLREIARYLTTPSWTGLYLSRGAIERLARALGLPRGFGAKAEMLETLLRTAAQYEQLPAVTAALGAHCDRWQAGYAGAIDDAPHLKAFIRPWQAQIGPTRQLLRGLGDGLQVAAEFLRKA